MTEGRSSAEVLAAARELVDSAHALDPERTSDGIPAETVYADRMERWVSRLVPGATPLLLLAARCQHLERWSIPRDGFAMDRAGYNAWRRALYRRQADRARELLLQAGIAASDADDVATWVAKTGLLRNPATQALEDAACLVFLENEVSAFASKHADYPREKFLTIFERIWRKMSPAGRARALELELPPGIAELLREATGGT
jgi:tRNAThr (cytosine32-N3)-methyltransferase